METIGTVANQLADDLQNQNLPTPISDTPKTTSKPSLPRSEGQLWPAGFPTSLQVDPHRHPEFEAACRAVIAWNKAERGGIALLGGTGSGKTTLAKIAMWAIGGELAQMPRWDSRLNQTYYPATYYNEPRLLDTIREGFDVRQKVSWVVRAKQANCLIIDDIGAAHVKGESAGWLHDIYWQLFDERAMRKTMITTNLSLTELKRLVGFRAFSRLEQIMSGNWLSLMGVPDYRKGNG